MAESDPENSSIPYDYSSLESEYHIRIIRLEPSLDRHAPLRFSFEHGRLADLQHNYEAISYTWGDPSFLHRLYSAVDNTFLGITKNLDAALRRFRDAVHVRLLWADAVCINQSDDEEKAFQIPLMKEIYQGARQVLVWLGGGFQEEAAVRFLYAASRKPRDPLPTSEESRTIVLRQLFAFFNLPYFGRRWIIQEIVLNPDCSLYCGRAEISWIRFMAAIESLNNMASALKTLSGVPFETLETLFSLWQFWTRLPFLAKDGHRDKNVRKILTILNRFDAFQCSEPRDRLYAL
ncbi:HET-domain-containing protein, partial [Lindgomyces ingoldianus]